MFVGRIPGARLLAPFVAQCCAASRRLPCVRPNGAPQELADAVRRSANRRTGRAVPSVPVPRFTESFPKAGRIGVGATRPGAHRGPALRRDTGDATEPRGTQWPNPLSALSGILAPVRDLNSLAI